MKKILTILAVAILTTATLFAQVNFSGSLTSGYVFNWQEDGFKSYLFGDDNFDTNSTTLRLRVADDSGIWSGALEGALYVDGSNTNDGHQNRIAGDISVNIAKIIDVDSEWNLTASLVAYDRITALRAYTNKSGMNADRVRTNEPGVRANLVAGYGNLIQFQIGGSPTLSGEAAGLDKASDPRKRGDLIISALTVPYQGIRVSADWALTGDRDNTAGVFGAAADINIGAITDLDFDLGVGVADKIYYQEGRNVLAVQVYGGVDAFDAYAEYVLEDTTNRLHAGINLNVLEDIALNVYGGIRDFAKMSTSYYVGGNIGYTVAGIKLNLNAQYAGADSDSLSDVSNGGIDTTGFSLTPSVSVSF